MDIINDSAKLLYEAAKFVVEKQECTETGLQRKFKLGYNAAYRITEQHRAPGYCLLIVVRGGGQAYGKRHY